MKNECKEYAQNIANELKALYNMDDDEREKLEEDGEPSDIYGYIADALDVEYTLDSNRELIGVRLYVTLGGPTAWIDTRNGEAVCAWGGDKESAWIPSEICDEINEYFAELF